jgi:hypothetical protein
MALKGSTRHIADHGHVISIRLLDVGLAIEVELIICIRGEGGDWCDVGNFLVGDVD